MNDLEASAEPMSQSHQIQKPMAPLVFIHAAPRTSSTWFWTKFRELPSTLCLYEPFNFTLNWLTQARALRMGGNSWHSRHSPTAPYFQEYAPLLKNEGGIQFFEPAMTMQWFIPQGGLRGALRPSEENYLALLIRHADQAGKVTVFGDCWSLGRCWSIKKAIGGFHIFQYRNLWQQWLSYLSYKRRGDMTFYATVMDTLYRDDDAYFSYLLERGLKHAAEPWTDKGQAAKTPLRWTRIYENVPRDEEKVRQLELMPEHHTFALFMGLHIYLYLHAQLSVDLVVDVTRMARDEDYRSSIEQDVRRYTGLAASFSDVRDIERPSGVEVDVAAINWDEIKEYARVAVKMLSTFADPARLMVNAIAFIDGTIDELRKCEAQFPVPSGVVPIPATEAMPLEPDQGEPAATQKSDVRIKTIGLCMIVKNETKVILQCLTSALPLIDYILIVDTGSEDGTQQMIRDFLLEHHIRGAVIDEPWRDFAYNRSFALARLREVEDVDYALIIDADDLLVPDAGFDPRAFKTRMEHDLYDLEIFHGNISFSRPQICRNSLEFSFKGVLHEYLEKPTGDISRATATGFRIQTSRGGARSQNPRKYQDDAAVLERTLKTETDPFLISRYTFYLAQSYRDSGNPEKAIEQYLRRAELGFWNEEIYISLYQAARLQAGAELPVDEVLATYQRAIEIVPHRAEAIHGASRLCRNAGRNRQGYEIAKRGIGLTLPANGLFVEPWIYNYGLLDEFAINAYWAGHYREALDASIKLISSPSCPERHRAQFAANVRLAAKKLPDAPNLGSLGDESFVKQHALEPPTSLRSRLVEEPRVLIAILAKQKERSLPLYLECIEALDYPKSSIVLYIRTNNNTDGTERILRDWVAQVAHLYAHVEFDAEDVNTRVEQFGVHEWNATRFRVLGRIRNISLRRALEHECDFYFVSDVDNFICPCTLRELVALNLPIVAPLLRSIDPSSFYSNYHAEVDANGYYKACDQYRWILSRLVRGVMKIPVVHCTYLIRADVLSDVTYEDATARHEYVVFSDSARKSNVPQYLDNRQVYGYITFDEGDSHHVEGGIERARTLLDVDLVMMTPRERLSNPPILSRAEPENPIRKKFDEIYQKNQWGYGSGVGSLPINNIHYMEFVQSFIKNGGIKSVVDFGCGDWQFSRFMNWNGASYVGFDLVPGLIETNRKVFVRPGISFEVLEDSR